MIVENDPPDPLASDADLFRTLYRIPQGALRSTGQPTMSLRVFSHVAKVPKVFPRRSFSIASEQMGSIENPEKSVLRSGGVSEAIFIVN